MTAVGTPQETPVSAQVVPNKPRGGWLNTEGFHYNPDQEFGEDSLKTEITEYAKRFAVRESYKIEGTDKVCTPGLDAVLMAPVFDPKKSNKVIRWHPEHVTSAAAMKQFNESTAGKYKRLRETMGDGFDFSPGNASFDTQFDATQLIDQEYVPMMWGPFYKQLYVYDYLKMHARAFELVNHNALAASAVKLLTRFTLGRGISFVVKHPQARAVWEEFWERNDMKKKLRQIARDLTWQGEIMLRYYDNGKGYLTLKVIDPSTCWEIVTDPEDFEKVYYYHFQWPTPYQIWVTGKIPVTKYIIQQIPPTNIQHLKINVSAMEKRGRSDLLPAMPWFKRFNDFYNGTTVKAILEANLVYKIKVKGDDRDVQAIKADPQLTILPPPGGVWVENEALTLEAISAQLSTGGARGAQGIGQQIASIIATSLNLPSEYFNVEQGAAARATALVRTDPAVKTIEDRQQLLRELLEEVYDRVIENAINSKRIDPSAARTGPEEVDDDEDE